ncbi:DUF4956 domain-containing protein [Brooklawnia cerclae]|uniref:DUF4956 domain-containing protein n=1 Tax=Brooklawnia cerclae TaxID=349934 RepID=A0ABX0SDD4_9ACTN|nr:DUF4956 domain-containing protein [Brooklawnia cerclae]NIH55981.1 hypothetical protein [Brooklawnia cerclae]
MDSLIMIVIDEVAITILALGIYFTRHRRRDLVVAFLGVNTGVLAVASVLGSVDVGIGLGMGLFGVLSIIRLRSSEIEQHEVAYYFSALSIGLIAGLGTGWVAIALIGLVLVVMFIGDHPSLLSRYREHVVNVDEAITDEQELRERVEQIVGGRVRSMTVQRLDLVNDTTLVRVCYQTGTGKSRSPQAVHTDSAGIHALTGAARDGAVRVEVRS